ncbi:hypothetical protein BKA58DRAFT_418581 [Alternaria rosae]|uniref:uncharacterized protein n=1 Tax=Alternaria rosae TaxID=1187941 RepID=UPI001E8E1CFC|nr:uncharacterized protein BKA58DRAFT_418581 [Alternaria rosae]KAH6879224.1 hypothetical protein BKA58DRAFT_418581 [Alternaria rosae]
MAKIGGDHIDVDTHQYPSMPASCYGKASEVLPESKTRRIFNSDIGSSESGHADSLIVDMPLTTHLTSTAHSQQTQPSILVPAVYTDTTPEHTRPIGAIFAIILAGITGFAISITLLTRYLQRARQEKNQIEEEDAALEDVLHLSKLNERAWNVGLKRLHKASIRKWSIEEASAQLVGVLGRPNLDTKTPWLQGCAEREMLEKLFEQEEKVRRGDREKALPMCPQ